MNWKPILDTVVPPLVLAFGTLLASLVTWLGLMLRKKLGLDVAAKKMAAYSELYRAGVIYAEQAKRDPHQPNITSGADAQKAAIEFARVLAELVKLPEPDWDTRRMLSDAEVGKLRTGITGGPTLHAENVSITTNSVPPQAVTP
jgi:hypothetical protein